MVVLEKLSKIGSGFGCETVWKSPQLKAGVGRFFKKEIMDGDNVNSFCSFARNLHGLRSCSLLEVEFDLKEILSSLIR